MNNNVVYFHINPLTNKIFYVGIGNEKRPYVKRRRSELWNKVVSKYGYIVDIIETGLSWERACELEKQYIKFIGRIDNNTGTLVNHTNGGDGFGGCKHSEETKKKMSLAQKGRKFSEESKKKMSLAQKGKPGSKHSEESKLKMSLVKKGIPKSEEVKKKMSESRKGQIPWNKGLKKIVIEK